MNRAVLIAVACCTVFAFSSCKSVEAAKRKRYMNHTYRGMKKSIVDAQVIRLDDTVKVIFPFQLLFDFNSAEIRKEAQPLMQRFSDALNKYKKTAIMICGHTDSIGSKEYNNKLSQNRADSTRKLLRAYKVKEGRLHTWGMGSRHPAAPNDTEEGRAKNRRVEFVILYDASNSD
jgi:outer membrane protein OmpA-like peptidoglycan-associated protein